MIIRQRVASVGRDLGIPIYNQEMLEWQEHLKEATEVKPGEKSIKTEIGSDFIRETLLIFNPHPKPSNED